jgi:hypothetical protein
MQYTVSMTSRMLAIAALCAFLLCVLLFLLGVELGKRFAEPPAATPALPAVAAPTLPSAPAVPAVPAAAAPPSKP